MLITVRTLSKILYLKQLNLLIRVFQEKYNLMTQGIGLVKIMISGVFLKIFSKVITPGK
jgi:hypothetical protein